MKERQSSNAERGSMTEPRDQHRLDDKRRFLSRWSLNRLLVGVLILNLFVIGMGSFVLVRGHEQERDKAIIPGGRNPGGENGKKPSVPLIRQGWPMPRALAQVSRGRTIAERLGSGCDLIDWTKGPSAATTALAPMAMANARYNVS